MRSERLGVIMAICSAMRDDGVSGTPPMEAADKEPSRFRLVRSK